MPRDLRSGPLGATLSESRRYLGVCAAIAVVYFALARLGIRLAYHGEDASLVWPAHGFAVAVLILFGTRVWPAIAAAVLASALLSGAPPISAAAVAAGNALGPVVGVLLFRALRFRPSLERVRDVTGLFLVAGMVSSVLSATVGAATLTLRGVYPPETVVTHWAVWWAGDMTGLVTVTPLLLVWARRPGWLARRAGWFHFPLAMLLAATVCLVALGLVAPFPSGYPLTYLLFPVAGWLAIRFEQHGAVSLTLVAAALAIWQTLNDAGPFSHPSNQQTLLHLQAFVAVMAVSSLVLATLIEERRRMEREQHRLLRRERKAREAAQQAVAAREKALLVVSHEIRNPLATVLLNSSALLEPPGSDVANPWRRSALRSIMISAEQIEHVVRDLQDITRLEAGQIALERAACSPAVLLLEAEAMLRPLAVEQGISLDVSEASGLPLVLAHPERILQVLNNLVGNSIRLSARGARIGIAATVEDGQVWFEVEDSGPGMSGEQIAELMRPFWKSAAQLGTGRGLGIPISRAIVAAHGGQFHVHSEPGCGCRIRFSLPPAGAEPAASSERSSGGVLAG